MHNAHDATVPEESLHAGYEIREMHAAPIVWSIIGLFIMTAASLVIIVMLMMHYDKTRPPMGEQQKSPFAAALPFAPAAPPLQADPPADKKALFEKQEARLSGDLAYGWMSKEPGVERVHIPVQRAMELIAEGKVPYRQKPQSAVVPATAQQGGAAAAASK